MMRQTIFITIPLLVPVTPGEYEKPNPPQAKQFPDDVSP